MSLLSLLLFPPTVPDSVKGEVLPEGVKVVGKPRGNPRPNHSLANEGKIDAARKRYQEVMGTEWVRTIVIEDRLGKGRSTAIETLRQFEKRGELECRPYEGGPYNRRAGYEWRWK